MTSTHYLADSREDSMLFSKMLFFYFDKLFIHTTWNTLLFTVERQGEAWVKLLKLEDVDA